MAKQYRVPLLGTFNDDETSSQRLPLAGTLGVTGNTASPPPLPPVMAGQQYRVPLLGTLNHDEISSQHFPLAGTLGVAGNTTLPFPLPPVMSGDQYRIALSGVFNDQGKSQRLPLAGILGALGGTANLPIKPDFKVNRYRVPLAGVLDADGMDASYRLPLSGTHATFSQPTLGVGSVSSHSNIYRRRRLRK